jgi:hypothetical protein
MLGRTGCITQPTKGYKQQYQNFTYKTLSKLIFVPTKQPKNAVLAAKNVFF